MNWIAWAPRKLGSKGKERPFLVEINTDLYLAEKERLTAQLEAQRLKLEKTERDFKGYKELYNRGSSQRASMKTGKTGMREKGQPIFPLRRS